MSQDNIIKDYVKGNIRPTEEERRYVEAKYTELREVLNDGTGNIFRSGSFARHTATTPIHDLDVIWVDESYEAIDDPRKVLEDLARRIEQSYEESDYAVPKIKIQSHSATLLFDDINGGFAIDVVPAIKADDGVTNEYGQPIFMVPEILLLNHHNRMKFYHQQDTKPRKVNWLLTDPKGYIRESKLLNDETDNKHRALVRVIKSWRSKMKNTYGDSWKLKSFHAEQICVQIFSANPDLTLIDSLAQFYSCLPNYVTDAPIIEDRAYASDEDDKYIDSEMGDGEKVTSEMKDTIISEANAASQQVNKLGPMSDSETIEQILRTLTRRSNAAATAQPQTYRSVPRPYLEY